MKSKITTHEIGDIEICKKCPDFENRYYGMNYVDAERLFYCAATGFHLLRDGPFGVPRGCPFEIEHFAAAELRRMDGLRKALK